MAAVEMEADLVCGICEGPRGCVELFGDLEQLVLCVY